jgi:hypothetical protein
MRRPIIACAETGGLPDGSFAGSHVPRRSQRKVRRSLRLATSASFEASALGEVELPPFSHEEGWYPSDARDQL